MKIVLTLLLLLAQISLVAQLDTVSITNMYAESEYVIENVILDEMHEKSTVNLELVIEDGSLISTDIEKTLIKMKLEYPDQINLNLTYSNDQKSLTDNVLISQLVQELYPEKYIDFLKYKEERNWEIEADVLTKIGIEENMESFETLIKQNNQGRKKVDKKDGLYINNRSITSFFEVGAKDETNCECDFVECMWECIDVHVVVEIILDQALEACLESCKNNPASCPCLAIIIGGTSALCAGTCYADPCFFKECKPDQWLEGEDAQDKCNNGIRQSLKCNCEGTGSYWEDRPCPSGQSCCGSECVDCVPKPIEAHTDKKIHDPKGGIADSRELNRACNCDYDIIVNATIINEEGLNTMQNGEIQLEVIGPHPIEKYIWSDNPNINERVRTNLSAGQYCVQIIDRRCCSTEKCFTVKSDYCENLDWGIGFMVEHACEPGSGAIMTSTQNVGGYPYQYLWSNGHTSLYPVGLDQGIYTVTITNSKNCKFTESIMVGGPESVVDAYVEGTLSHACPSDNSFGKIDITPHSTYLDANHTYSWNDPAMSTTQDVEGLAPGFYTVTVTDYCGATFHRTFEVKEQFIVHWSNPSDFGENNGTIAVKMQNLMLPVCFNFINDETGPVITNGKIYDEDFFLIEEDQLPPGDYTIEFTGKDGCMVTHTQTLLECAEPIYTPWELFAYSACRQKTRPSGNGCFEEVEEQCINFDPNLNFQYDLSTGQYCAEIKCTSAECFDFPTDYQVCFTPEYGEWEEVNGEYCRNVTCADPNELYLCSELDIIIEECGYLSNCGIPNLYVENPECLCDIIIYNQNYSEQFSKPAISTFAYDSFLNKCKETLSCDDGLTYPDIIQTDPTNFGAWQFNTFSKKCERTVFCDDPPTIPNANIGTYVDDETTITWKHGGIYGNNCVAEIDCKETVFGTTDHPVDLVENDGLKLEDWDLTFELDCIHEVKCFYIGGTEETFVYTNQPPPTSGGSGLKLLPLDGDSGPKAYQCYTTYYCGNDSEDIPISIATCELLDNGNCRYTCNGFIVDGPCNSNNGCPPGAVDDYSENRNINAYKQISINPNPFTSEFIISNIPQELKFYSIRIFDVNGILKKEIKDVDDKEYRISLKDCSSGIYFLQLTSNDLEFSVKKKIVKVE